MIVCTMKLVFLALFILFGNVSYFVHYGEVGHKC